MPHIHNNSMIAFDLSMYKMQIMAAKGNFSSKATGRHLRRWRLWSFFLLAELVSDVNVKSTVNCPRQTEATIRQVQALSLWTWIGLSIVICCLALYQVPEKDDLWYWLLANDWNGCRASASGCSCFWDSWCHYFAYLDLVLGCPVGVPVLFCNGWIIVNQNVGKVVIAVHCPDLQSNSTNLANVAKGRFI